MEQLDDTPRRAGGSQVDSRCSVVGGQGQSRASLELELGRSGGQSVSP